MSLAAILLVSVCWASSAPSAIGAWHPSARQVTSTTDGTAAAQNQETAPPAQNPPPPSQSQAPAKTSQTSAKPHEAAVPKKAARKKKTSSSDCNSASTATGQAASAPTSPNTKVGDSNTGSSNSGTNCPPSKVIVRQGGASEPSIQLAGGPAGSGASNQRDTANRMLEATDTNLKQIAGRELSSTDKETMNQIRQFMTQSKQAIEDGDLERARTLAWKAQTLSEDLVKPAK